jgi:hypothetical protein
LNLEKNMKKIFVTTAIIALCATSASAWERNNTNTNKNANLNANLNANKNVSASESFAVSGSTSWSDSAAAAGASARGASSSTNVNTNVESSAYAPDVNIGECQIGASAGIPGAVVGIGLPAKHCRVIAESKLIEYYWGKQAAGQHLYANNQRIRKTVNSVQQPATVRTSTRSRNVSYVSATPSRGEDR